MEKFDFEALMEELQQVVNSLEKGDLSLDESVEIFQRGIKLSKLCAKKLDEVEKKVTILLEQDNGYIKEQDFLVEGE